MAFVHDFIKSHISSIQPTYRTLTAIGHIVMLGASIATVTDPVGMATNMGLPLPKTDDKATTTDKKSDDKNDKNDKTKAVVLRQTVGWPLAFADRNLCLALNGLLLNYLGEFRALAVMGQVLLLAGLGDAYATWKYGVPGSWRGHLIPTLAMSWMGPLGLIMYF